MNIAIIPARGGSKRISRKNIREFCGKAMIGWSVEAAIQSELFDQVIVSTDCSEIAQVARAHGATTPFTRPEQLSDDFTPTIPVVRHAIDWLKKHDTSPTNVCCIYATAPFIQVDDLKGGLEILTKDNNLEFVFPVTEYGFPIQRSLKIENERVTMNWPEHELTRTQDLPSAYHDAGQFYWGKSDAWFQHDGFYSARSAPIVLPSWRVQDIDTIEDWKRAELMFPIIRASVCDKNEKRHSKATA